jgi:transposase
VVDRGPFRTNTAGVDRRFRSIHSARVAMENGTHSIWVSEQIKELGHEVIVVTFGSCERYPIATVRVTKSMQRKSHAMHGLIRRS